MTGISWGKGFFRLWFVVSILWIITITAITFQTSWYPAIYPKTISAVEKTDPVTGFYPESGSFSYQQKQNGQAVVETFAMYPGWQLYRPTNISTDEHVKIVEKAIREIDDTINKSVRKARVDYLWSLSILALLPPLLLLLLGLMVRWIVMGFRKSA